MELETRLVFIDTSAYEKKKLQFGIFALARLERLVTEGKIQLLITDVVRSEIETHLKKMAHDAVTEHKKFRKSGSSLCIADEVTGGGLFTDFTAEAVFNEAIRKFRTLVDNGYTENVSVETVNPRQIFAAYFTGAPPFHREAKKSEFPDAFSLAAVDALARARVHKVYVVSGDGDMAAVADANDNFIYLPGIDELLDLVNRNDAELADLSVFADTVLELLRENILTLAREKLEDGEYLSYSSGDADPELSDLSISAVTIAELQLIEVDQDGATYDLIFDVTLTASYDFADYSHANWDKEDRLYYGVIESNESFLHQEQYSATLEIGFSEGLRSNAEICLLQFEDSIFDLNLDEAQYVETEGTADDVPQEPDPF